MIPSQSLQLGIVVASYPQGAAVDVLLPDSGSRLANVQVMGMSSDSTGTMDLPDPGLPQDDTRWNIDNNAPRNIIAVIASYKGIPLCLGFITPQIGQMTFAEKNRRIVRHASDVYETTDQYGNHEWYHPSGTFWRVGLTNTHEDLTGQDYDGEWAIKNNTTTAPYVHLTVANAGTVHATVEVDPAGNITVTNVGNLTGTVTGAVSLTAASFTLNGSLTVNGNATITGTLTESGDAVIDGVNIKTHTHTSTTPGTPTSAPI